MDEIKAKAGWSNRPNVDLWKVLFALVEQLHPTFQWVKGHNGDVLNEECDKMANRAIHDKRESALTFLSKYSPIALDIETKDNVTKEEVTRDMSNKDIDGLKFKVFHNFMSPEVMTEETMTALRELAGRVA